MHFKIDRQIYKICLCNRDFAGEKQQIVNALKMNYHIRYYEFSNQDYGSGSFYESTSVVLKLYINYFYHYAFTRKVANYRIFLFTSG